MSECYWIKDRKPDGDPIWRTTCGNIHEFMTGGPDYNNHRFCPYCGGRLAGTVRRVLGVKIDYGPHRIGSTSDGD